MQEELGRWCPEGGMLRKAERMVRWELCSLEHWEQGQGGTGEGEYPREQGAA